MAEYPVVVVVPTFSRWWSLILFINVE
jgi:hypothetical protein